MLELKIHNIDSVTIKDNIIRISCGYSSVNLIPISHIFFLGEVYTGQNLGAQRLDNNTSYFSISINDNIKIKTNSYPQHERSTYHSIIHGIYNKISKALSEYHTSSFRLNKPKDINVEQK